MFLPGSVPLPGHSAETMAKPAETPPFRFAFINNLDLEFDLLKVDVRQVTFHTSRNNIRKTETLKFKPLVSRAAAIKRVQQWLSQPMTQVYANLVAHQFVEGQRKCDALEGCIFMDSVDIEDGKMTIHTGS